MARMTAPATPPTLLGALLVSLPRDLKLVLEINYFLRHSGIDVVTSVAVHRALLRP